MGKGKCMPTNDGYPTDDELQKIKKWDGIKDPHGLLDFLESVWHWPDWGFNLTGKRILKLYLSTGGWSGNEDIIRTLRETTFWNLYWQQSKVGGHYRFRIYKMKKENRAKRNL